ncbi:hypothetical protein K493DRAFT_317999 [Basidiobolus meristosporus CBS 931.73]|uniref:Uncharacterized protein n=1 Tax=Basidiobolus meristosporus CBS 931.73 TaxID=1314790 RepID=A0A1Y1XXM9_9FUNG|nr:hypothetical protein K493DRAFT_317999 [Basidiobolus meristosporus CBS 931.73]|eukprot:ORX90405.1 hypothetical protein K493DRAFT_317999 [Basidiobolus meristosporus CBS 931.73]
MDRLNSVMETSSESLLPEPPSNVSSPAENPALRRSYLENFRRICVDFYVNEDPVAGELMGLVEFANKTNGQVVLNWLATERLKTPRSVLEERLLEIGLQSGKMLYPEDWELYIKEKNQIRSTWHANNQLKTQQEFNELLLRTEPIALSMFERARELRRFLRTWTPVLGAAPFIKGLKRTLETQFGKAFLITWAFLDDSLTQAGPEFMRDSTRLLLSVLGFTQTADLENTERGEGNGVIRVWQANPNLGDIQLDRLLSMLPKERGLPGRMAGSIQIGSTRRAPDLVVKSTILKCLLRWPGRLILWLAQLVSDLQYAA